MRLRKSTPGSDSFGNEWKTEKSVVEVPDWQGEQLLRIKDAGFTRLNDDDEDESAEHPEHESENPNTVRFPHAGGRAEAPEGAFAKPGEVLPDDKEHPALHPATQSVAPAHAYADDRNGDGDGEQQQHREVWDALADKREEELDREKDIKEEPKRNEAIKAALVDAEQGNQANPQETHNADVLGDSVAGGEAEVLEPHPTGATTAADATGKTRRGAKPRGVRGDN